MKLKKLAKYLFKALPFALCAAILLAVAFYPQAEAAADATPRVVRVWNVDTFEGGKGSRTSFLKKAARAVEKEKDVYYLISSYTAEGARSALKEGVLPDVLSFVVGLSDFAESGLSLPFTFAGGSMQGKTLAYPWCRGEYILFSLCDDFAEEGTTVISNGGSNLTAVAAAYAGITGEERESLTAYVAFLNGEFRYLLGTQRDRCRFQTRGVQVYEKALNEYCDLFQYYSVLSSEKRDDALSLLEALLSEETQNALSDIGMLPVGGTMPRRTVSVFSSEEALENAGRIARSGGDLKNLDKFLKTI